jgi:hypothetical protein
MNDKKAKEKFDLNQFRSQSVQDRETFLNTHYNAKQTLKSLNQNQTKIELDNKITDLNQGFAKKLQLKEPLSNSAFSASASIPISSGYSSFDFLNSSAITETPNSACSSDNNPNSKQNNESCFFDSIYETNPNAEEAQSRSDEDGIYSLSNDINSFPCMTQSNRIDELVPSVTAVKFNSNEANENATRFRNNTNFIDSDDFLFVSLHFEIFPSVTCFQHFYI